MLSESVSNNLKRASWIRAMFEEGERLRKIHGADKVFDFTLGNPDHEPPKSVKESLKKIVLEDRPGIHRYMSNAGHGDVRQKLANHINNETGLSLSSKHIVMTCGAAGGLNVVLKSILNPGEEVILLSPFFAEYVFYTENHGGKTVVVTPEKGSFKPDLDLLKNSINEMTSGSGIGLSIAQHYVQLLGGELKLESTPDVGTTFIFDLPFMEGRGYLRIVS